MGIARPRAGIGRSAITRVCGICRFIVTSGTAFSASEISGRRSYVSSAVIAVTRIARIGAAVACAAITRICGIGRFIGTGGAGFPALPITRGNGNIRSAVIAIAVSRFIRAAVACAAAACVNRIGGSIAACGAGFTRSVRTGRYRYITRTVITVSAVTRIRAGIACAAVTCIC